MIMKTRITNIVKYLLASVAVLVSAVCANAQDYAYPPVDAVVVTPGASGVRVDWGFPFELYLFFFFRFSFSTIMEQI